MIYEFLNSWMESTEFLVSQVWCHCICALRKGGSFCSITDIFPWAVNRPASNGPASNTKGTFTEVHLSYLTLGLLSTGKWAQSWGGKQGSAFCAATLHNSNQSEQVWAFWRHPATKWQLAATVSGCHRLFIWHVLLAWDVLNLQLMYSTLEVTLFDIALQCHCWKHAHTGLHVGKFWSIN